MFKIAPCTKSWILYLKHHNYGFTREGGMIFSERDDEEFSGWRNTVIGREYLLVVALTELASVFTWWPLAFVTWDSRDPLSRGAFLEGKLTQD